MRRHAAVGKVRGQVHADEDDLEAADEEAEGEQHVAAVAERLAQRLAGRLLERVRNGIAALDECRGERKHQQAERAQCQQRAVPTEMHQQPLRERQQRELSERAQRAAEMPSTMLRFSGGNLRPSTPAITLYVRPESPTPISTPAVSTSVSGSARVGHRDEAEHIEQRARDDDPCGAVAVGDHAGERLCRAPQQVLHGDRERKRFASPAEVSRHRLQEEPEAVTDAHRKDQHEPAAHEHDGGRAPIGAALRSHRRSSDFGPAFSGNRPARDAASRFQRALRSAHRDARRRAGARPAPVRAASAVRPDGWRRIRCG